MNIAHTPISCSFYDYLENSAQEMQACKICYKLENGKAANVSSPIVDVFHWQGADYLQLERGQLIRMDRLLSVNDTTPPLFS